MLVALATACGGSPQKKAADAQVAAPDMHTAEISLDYEGTYTGVMPAADCPGIEVTLILNPDDTYALHQKYLERDSEFDAAGAYTLSGNLLTLEGDSPEYYRVEENRLRRLDADKKPIEGELASHYILNKAN